MGQVLCGAGAGGAGRLSRSGLSDAFAGRAAADEAERVESDDGVGQGFLEGVVFRLEELEFEI